MLKQANLNTRPQNQVQFLANSFTVYTIDSLNVDVTLPTQIQEVMESFMKELDNFVKIINSCFTDQVLNWKESDLQRVIDWADYFKKVKIFVRFFRVPAKFLCG